MKITICGSIAHFDKMQEIQRELESLGHGVKLPPTEVPDKEGKMISVSEYYTLRKEAFDDDQWVWDRKEQAMRKHMEKISWADAVLVANYKKGEVENYIGSNTLIEMGVAFWLQKPIFLLNPIPDISAREEILGMKPIVLNGDFTKIENYLNKNNSKT